MGKRCISARAVGFFFRSSIVNCRIGSLETEAAEATAEAGVNCRIGSLEMQAWARDGLSNVNCRIGSLEN